MHFFGEITSVSVTTRRSDKNPGPSVREQEVLKLILSGKSNREIAEALYISENTVKTHIRNIFSKYDVTNHVELVSTLLKNQTSE